MGLVMEGDRYRILTDIQYIEDASGHMDFKVAGTRDGITAIHLDIKKPGLPLQVLREALAQAREARLRILDNMEMALPAPRPDISPYAPRMISMRVDTTQIGLVIGPGGRTIRKIEADFGVDIDIEDDGTVTISSPGGKGAQEARQYIEDLTRTIEVGEEFAARVVSTKPFGAFVELIPGKEALLHISDIAWEHVDKTEDVLNVGDEVQVKVTEVNDDGKLRVSRKVLLARGEGFGRERRNGGPDRRPGGDHRREGSDRRREGGDRGRSGARPPRREGSGGEGGGPKPYFREKKRED
jgi:polyribonucleotide nucleotidyltransferase